MSHTGKFVISLDFELLWGVRDKRTIASYGKHIRGVWEVLPSLLKLFERYQIKATFATVGFLFASNKKELLAYCPDAKPSYKASKYSPYQGHFDLIHETEEKDPYHFATDLIQLLQQYPEQEIASHTFSHYYCLEEGQTQADFEADMLAALQIAKAKDIQLRSLVFPRNQFNEHYIQIIEELGITSYRGNEKVWFHNPAKKADEKLYKRAFRLLDAYLNISGHNCYELATIKQQTPYNIPSSRFLRPFSPKVKILDTLRLKRILKSMSYAAKNNQLYHLWWHPHNFGTFQKENLAFLEQILSHYQHLHQQYQFESMTMQEIAQLLNTYE